MIREFTCIICPNGCDLVVNLEDNNIISIEGALCKKGRTYVEQELIDPQRTISSSVLVNNGEIPLVSVRLNRPIPKDKIFDVMEEIKKIKVEAPVKIGTVLRKNILGLDSDLIVTKNVDKKLVVVSDYTEVIKRKIG
jgi:CxxC motif-containing protein